MKKNIGLAVSIILCVIFTFLLGCDFAVTTEKLKSRVSILETEIETLKTEVKELKMETKELKETLKTDVFYIPKSPLSCSLEASIDETIDEEPDIPETIVAVEETEEEQESVSLDFVRDDIPMDAGTQYLLKCATEEFDIPYELGLAVVYVETNYKNVIGDGGNAYGYMQIWPKWVPDIMKKLEVTDLNDPSSNFRVGCYILRDNIDRCGTYERALTKYNTGRPGTSAYATKVLNKFYELTASAV